jgi:hypothetical protein
MVVVGELKFWMDYMAHFLKFRSIIIALGVLRFWRHYGHINHVAVGVLETLNALSWTSSQGF